jgi:hypothetical protein
MSPCVLSHMSVRCIKPAHISLCDVSPALQGLNVRLVRTEGVINSGGGASTGAAACGLMSEN